MNKLLLFILIFLFPCAAFSQQWFSSPAPNGRDINCIKIFNRDTIISAGGWHIVNQIQTEISPALFKTNISGLGLWNVLTVVDTNDNWIRSMDFTDNNNGIAVGWGGKIYTTTDGGDNWGAMSPPIKRDFNKIFFINAQEMLIAGGEHSDSVTGGIQTVLKTINGGQTWNVAMDQPGKWLHSLYFINATIGYAVGDSGTILKSINGGDTWSPVTSPIQRNFNAIWFTDANTGFIAGGQPSNDSIRTILQTTNGGNTWTILKDELGGMLRDIHFVNTSTGYAVGDSATVLKTSDGGLSWVPQAIPGTVGDEQFNAVRFHDPDFGFVAGKWGVQYIYNTALAPEAYTTGDDVIDTIQVTLNGLVNSHGENCVYSFVFSIDNFFTTIYETPYPGYIRSNSFDPATYGVPLAWLTPDTSYGYLIKAWTLGGIAYGDTLSFYTGTTDSEIKTLSATGITETSAILNGSIRGYSIPVNLFFEYGTTPQFGSQIVATPASVNDTTLHTVTANLSALQPLTFYYFRLKGESGTSNYYGNTFSFFTGGQPFTLLQTEPATGVTDTSATLNGLVDGFKISATVSFDYSPGDMTFNNNASPALNVINDSLQHFLTANVTFLIPDTIYYFRLKAQTTTGEFYGDTLTFYPSSATPNIQTLPATGITLSSAQLNGRAGSFNEQVTLSFEYGITGSLGSEVQGNPSVISDTATYSVTAVLSGLQTHVIYYYRLKAELGSGAKAYGDIKQVYIGNSEIPNWDFQDWQLDTFVLPNSWNILNDDFDRVPGHSGDYALKVANQTFAVLGIFYDDRTENIRFLNGVPFHARPDSISAYIDYSFLPGDTGMFAVHLYDSLNNDICTNFFPISGNSGGVFKKMTFSLTYNSGLIPDTIIVGFLAWHPFTNMSPNLANYMIVDDIASVPSTPIYNSDFETWFNYPMNTLLGWNYLKHVFLGYNDSASVTQTLFDFPADYAAEVHNLKMGDGLWSGGEINNTHNVFGGDKSGGFPVFGKHAALNGYYKWLPANGDTMRFDIAMIYQGQSIGWGQLIQVDSVPLYTPFNIPITYTVNNVIPDSANLTIRSFSMKARGSSTLTVDKLSFDGFVGVEELNLAPNNEPSGIMMFPNPTTSLITIQLEKEREGVVEIFNLRGSLMYVDDFTGNKIDVNTVDFPKGLYLIRITHGVKRMMNKFMVIR